mgnify:FL=1
MNRSVLFRELDDTEVQEFQEWARANHKPGDPIEREIWHPVLVAECELIDSGTFTIWFQDGGGRQEFLSEDQMRKAAERFSFDADEVVESGETWIWENGVEPYNSPSWNSEDICGGCFGGQKWNQ